MDDCPVAAEMTSDESGPVTIRVAGPVTIHNVGGLLVQLVDVFHQAADVTIDLSGITALDAAGLQLFCSSHRSSIVANRIFRIIGQDQPAIREAAASAGHLRTSGCAIDTHHTCIWAGGNR